MSVQRSKIPISVELADGAAHLWEFLRLVDDHPWLYEGLHVHNAVRRYELFWLPMVAKADPRIPLAPPLDIKWIWYVHMISPYAYNRDCLHKFGRVIPHQILSTKERNIGLNRAREMWTRAFPNEQFSLDLAGPPNITNTFVSKFSYDLFSAALRQRFFNYQVALNHFRDSKFLEKAIKRYREFLCAKLEEPGLNLKECYDVQLVWHSHLVHPIQYRDDTRKVFGEMLSHYDTQPQQTIAGGPPVEDSKVKAPKAIPGAMYRGEYVICTREQILLTQQLEKLILKVKLAKENFLANFSIPSLLKSRIMMLAPCWMKLPSLSLVCGSYVNNATQGKGLKKYDVKVVHSLAPILSAVEVSHPKGFLVATSHTIAGKQIPMKNQLNDSSGNTCSYSPEAGERAMLIHSQKDWGVVVGRWVGDSETGDLEISFFNVEKSSWQTVNRSSSSQPEFAEYEITITDEEKSVFINLATCEVTVPYTDVATFLPEIVALAYSIGVLYMLCRKRSQEFYPVDPFHSGSTKLIQPCPLSKENRASRAEKRDGIFTSSSSGKKSTWLNRDPHVSNILLATGRNCPWTPSNSFLKYYHEFVPDVYDDILKNTTNDDIAIADAKLEMNYLLKYLGMTGMKTGAQGTKKESRKDRDAPKQAEEKHQRETSNSNSEANGVTAHEETRDPSYEEIDHRDHHDKHKVIRDDDSVSVFI